MEMRLIEFLLGLICALVLFRGVLMPLGKLAVPAFTYIVKWLYPLFQKSELDKQKEALELSKERVRIAELQKEAIKNEKKAMRIQDSIIDEEFEELNEEETFRTRR